uniref:Acetoacetyl-CoA synthetase n=1 Tax=Steinernema glaseri TaxID=37863 RepID=A0A1I7Z832_9BILA
MVAANGVGSRKGFYTPVDGQPNAEKEVMLRIQDQYHVQFANYEEFYRWTCDHYAQFWEVVLKYCDVKLGSPYKQVIDQTKTIADIPAWFEGATLNYAENCLRKGGDLDTAIIVASHDGHLTRYDYRTLRNDVAFVASALRKHGTGVGDHVCGYLPNMYETTVAMLATAAIGAVWSSASVDFGVVGVCDRFRQVVPKVLFTVDGVTYKGKRHCLKDKVNAIVQDLVSIEHVVVIPFLKTSVDRKDYEKHEKFVAWNDFKHCVSTKPLPLECLQVPFSHPLFVLFSSGTTGTPKAMVHTVGGTLLKHVEEHIVQANMKSSDVILFYTTCGWMMWNWLMSVLYTGASLVLYDESPLEPDAHILIKLCASTKATILGMGAKIYDEYTKRGEDFYSMYDLKQLRLVLSTGSPLKPASFDYINEYIRPGVVIGSISGGTDIVGCFMGCTLNLPVVRGECQHLYLGMDVHAYDHNGQSVEDEQGELVCVAPFPSMPSHFIGDNNGQRYKRAYFEKYPNIWAHGDFCLINSQTKGVVMLGRSDTTLNRGGVRIGTAEIYSVVDGIEGVEDCIVAGQIIPEADDEHIILFLKMRNGFSLDADIISLIKSRIRTQMSPRHVPNAFHAVPDIPYTNSGKKVELAVKQIINGESVEKVSSLRNPDALDHYKVFRRT